MKVTLYANCIVNNRYNEVFHNSVFDDYLGTLEQTDFDVDDVYTTFNGRFAIQNILTNNKNIYTYNYMKIETDSNQFEQGGFTRYCFIDNIDVRNGYVYVDYSEDIWHSYSKGINIRNSYLTRSRQLQYGNRTIPVYRLPLPYGGNNLPSIEVVNQPSSFLVVARIQAYKLTNGDTSNRRAYFCVIGNHRITPPTTADEPILTFNDISEVESVLTTLENTSSKEAFFDKSITGTDEKTTYYEIDDIHVIPSYFIPTIENIPSRMGSILIDGENTTTIRYDCYYLNQFFENSNNTINKFKTVYSGVINHDFHNVSFGALSKQIALDNNGSNLTYNIVVGGSLHEFQVLISIQNKLVDFTDDFAVELPFNAVTGDVVAQRKIARNTALISGAFNTIQGVSQIASGFSYEFIPAKLSPSTAVGPRMPGFDYNKYMDTLATEIFNFPTAKDIQKGGSKIVGGLLDIYGAITPKYRSATSVNTSTKGILNCVNFPVLVKMTADNTEEVEDAIDNIGYSVDEIFNTEAINSTFDDWNVVQFDFINLYGDFPQNIANALKAILRNGVKIWYTSNV